MSRTTSRTQESSSRRDGDEQNDIDYNEVGRAPFELNLAKNLRLCYDDGNWTPVQLPEDSNPIEMKQLMRENRQLKEENNLLKFKLEVVIDMKNKRQLRTSTKSKSSLALHQCDPLYGLKSSRNCSVFLC
eukprot:TRINITY_DN9824_c0_g2_i2.p1 TRINITY_DN9824_c0_g2~~TRINITY_DN9824_c0_g2_i2.p1  ORF type:complete len:130 (+),score=15.33 TRINITY_DN9824_c0_g2_i2:231-620(+)